MSRNQRPRNNGLWHQLEPIAVDGFVVDAERTLTHTFTHRRRESCRRKAFGLVQVGHSNLNREMAKAMDHGFERARCPGSTDENVYDVNVRRGDILLQNVEIIERPILNDVAVVKYGNRHAVRGTSGSAKRDGDKAKGKCDRHDASRNTINREMFAHFGISLICLMTISDPSNGADSSRMRRAAQATFFQCWHELEE